MMQEKLLKINSFKDKCDNCNKFDYLVGIDDKCLCSECIKKENKQNNQNNQKIIKKEQKQLNILDFIEKLSHFSHTIDDIM